MRRWDEHDLVETRRLIGEFKTREELSAAFQAFIDSNSVEASIFYRELDDFEQSAALERLGAFDFGFIRVLLGRRLIDRWDLWKPSIDAMGEDVYPMFEALAQRMRTVLDVPEGDAPRDRPSPPPTPATAAGEIQSKPTDRP